MRVPATWPRDGENQREGAGPACCYRIVFRSRRGNFLIYILIYFFAGAISPDSADFRAHIRHRPRGGAPRPRRPATEPPARIRH